MENKGYYADHQDGFDNDTEPGFQPRTERAHSITEDEDKITFAWSNLTVRTIEKKSRNYLLYKKPGKPSKTIVSQGNFKTN
jgi:hypothetical protein